ncbi:MAG: hypothetical protein COB16_03930 [Rhodobacteraceae bacterium]|nr:MAG: hypothetical protein COB16_03930 [Paracoccaceae bacterium]
MTYSINGVKTYADVATDPDTGKVISVDFALHSTNRAVLEAVALAKNLMVTKQETQKSILSPATYDQDTGELITAEVSEIVVLAEWLEAVRGANFFDVAVVLVPAVLDADGEVITPPVLDPGYNCNLRIGEPLVSNKDENGVFLWELLLLEWTYLGAEGTVNGKVPGVVVSGVSLVDLSKVEAPQMGWA